MSGYHQSVEHFAVYLTGRSFIVQTDHRALQFLQLSRHLNGRLTRWALTLQQYTFDVQYRLARTTVMQMASPAKHGARTREPDFSKRVEMSGLRPDSGLSKNRTSIYVVCVMVVRTLSCLSCNCMCICGCVVVIVTSLLVL